MRYYGSNTNFSALMRIQCFLFCVEWRTIHKKLTNSVLFIVSFWWNGLFNIKISFNSGFYFDETVKFNQSDVLKML